MNVPSISGLLSDNAEAFYRHYYDPNKRLRPFICWISGTFLGYSDFRDFRDVPPDTGTLVRK